MAEGLSAGFAFIDIIPRVKSFAREAKAEVDKAAGEMEASARQKFAAFGKVTSIAVVGAAVAIGVESVRMADKFEAAHARLESALKNTGSSFDQERGRVTALDKSLEKLGFTNTE